MRWAWLVIGIVAAGLAGLAMVIIAAGPDLPAEERFATGDWSGRGKDWQAMHGNTRVLAADLDAGRFALDVGFDTKAVLDATAGRLYRLEDGGWTVARTGARDLGDLLGASAEPGRDGALGIRLRGGTGWATVSGGHVTSLYIRDARIEVRYGDVSVVVPQGAAQVPLAMSPQGVPAGPTSLQVEMVVEGLEGPLPAGALAVEARSDGRAIQTLPWTRESAGYATLVWTDTGEPGMVENGEKVWFHVPRDVEVRILDTEAGAKVRAPQPIGLASPAPGNFGPGPVVGVLLAALAAAAIARRRG